MVVAILPREHVHRAVGSLEDAGQGRGNIVGLGGFADLVVGVEFGQVIGLAAVEAVQAAVAGQRVLRAAASEVRRVADVDRARQRRRSRSVGRLINADAEGRGVLAIDRVGHGKVAIFVEAETVHPKVRQRRRHLRHDHGGIGQHGLAGIGRKLNVERAACDLENAEVVPVRRRPQPWVHGARVGRGFALVHRGDGPGLWG